MRIGFQGGATVISSFLREWARDKSVAVVQAGGDASGGSNGLVDRVVVTIAPLFLGGYNVLSSASSLWPLSSRGSDAGIAPDSRGGVHAHPFLVPLSSLIFFFVSLLQRLVVHPDAC